MNPAEEIKLLEKRIKQLREESGNIKENLLPALLKTGYDWKSNVYNSNSYELQLNFSHPYFPNEKTVTFQAGFDPEFFSFYIDISEPYDFALEQASVSTIEEVVKQFLNFELKYYIADVQLVSPYFKESVKDYEYSKEYSIIPKTTSMTEVKEPILQFCTPICNPKR